MLSISLVITLVTIAVVLLPVFVFRIYHTWHYILQDFRYLFVGAPNVKFKNTEICIFYPQKLAKGSSSYVRVAINLSNLKSNLSERIDEGKVLEHITNSSLKTGKKVIVKLSSPCMDFSEKVTKELHNGINMVRLTVIPKEICKPGVQAALLSITNDHGMEEYASIGFEIEITDYVFDHVSKPFASALMSGCASIGSVMLFILTFLQRIDTTFGLPAGVAATMMAIFFGIQPTFLYQGLNTTKVNP